MITLNRKSNQEIFEILTSDKYKVDLQTAAISLQTEMYDGWTIDDALFASYHFPDLITPSFFTAFPELKSSYITIPQHKTYRPAPMLRMQLTSQLGFDPDAMFMPSDAVNGACPAGVLLARQELIERTLGRSIRDDIMYADGHLRTFRTAYVKLFEWFKVKGNYSHVPLHPSLYEKGKAYMARPENDDKTMKWVMGGAFVKMYRNLLIINNALDAFQTTDEYIDNRHYWDYILRCRTDRPAQDQHAWIYSPKVFGLVFDKVHGLYRIGLNVRYSDKEQTTLKRDVGVWIAVAKGTSSIITLRFTPDELKVLSSADQETHDKITALFSEEEAPV